MGPSGSGWGLRVGAKKGCLNHRLPGPPSEGPSSRPSCGSRRGLAKWPDLTTWLFGASLEEAFPTTLSSIDLCLEAILKNELIVGKAWVEGRGGGGEEQGQEACGGVSRSHLGLKVSVRGQGGMCET